MKFSQREIILILVAIQTTGKSNPMSGGATARIFPIAEMGTVAEIFKKLEELTDDKGQIKEGNFDLGFETSGKKLVLDCINDREWQAGDAQFVLSVTEKLERPIEKTDEKPKEKKVPTEK